MKTVTKTVKRYGNSGGVYLPAEWIGGEVKIELLKEPLDPKIDILGKLPLEHIISVILYGSYARGEMTKYSDVDIILVVDDTEAKIPSELKQKYDIQIKTSKQIRNAMAHDPIFYKSIKDGSTAIINRQFLEGLKETKLNLDGVRIHIDLAESSLGIVKTFAENYEDLTDLIYSIIMRLKEMLIIDCLFSNKKYTTKLLMGEILKHISSSEARDVMNVYRSIRDNKKYTKKVLEETVIKLISLLEANIDNVKQKAHKKGH